MQVPFCPATDLRHYWSMHFYLAVNFFLPIANDKIDNVNPGHPNSQEAATWFFLFLLFALFLFSSILDSMIKNQEFHFQFVHWHISHSSVEHLPRRMTVPPGLVGISYWGINYFWSLPKRILIIRFTWSVIGLRWQEFDQRWGLTARLDNDWHRAKWTNRFRRNPVALREFGP